MRATARRTARTAPASVRRRRSIVPYALIGSAVAVLLLASAYPLGWQVYTSMHEFGLAQQFGQPATFVGLANYAALFSDGYLWTVVLRSLAFCLVNATLTVVIGVLAALLMKSAGRAARLVLQVGMLLAWAMPVVASMTVWRWLFDWRRGVVNWLLGKAGLDGFAGHNWLERPLSFFFVATVIVVWMSVPFVAFSVYAGLTQISDEILEASEIDGASARQQLTGIILPMIRPVLSIVLLLQIIWDLRVFAQIRMLQDAGSTPSETNLLGTYIYQVGVGSGDYGMASAVSIFVLVLTVALSWFYIRSLLREETS